MSLKREHLILVEITFSIIFITYLVPCNQEITGSSHGNSLLQKCAYNRPLGSCTSLEPTYSGSLVHRTALFNFKNLND